jgi:hypothetical protein
MHGARSDVGCAPGPGTVPAPQGRLAAATSLVHLVHLPVQVVDRAGVVQHVVAIRRRVSSSVWMAMRARASCSRRPRCSTRRRTRSSSGTSTTTTASNRPACPVSMSSGWSTTTSGWAGALPPRRQLRDPFRDPAGDRRVGQTVEVRSRVRIVEDDVGERRTVEAAVVLQDPGTEARHELGEDRLARLDDLAGDDVGVDDRHAQGSEAVRRGRLPAADPAGQPHQVHVVSSSGRRLPPRGDRPRSSAGTAGEDEGAPAEAGAPSP